MGDRTWMLRHGDRTRAGLIAATLVALSGCASVTGERPSVPSEVRTLTSIGDQDLPVKVGEPGATVEADDQTATRVADATGPAIRGRVVDDRGDPVAGAEVRVAIGGTARGRTTRTETDEAGRFSLPNLREDGEYTVIAEVEDEQGRLIGGRKKVRAPRGQVEIVLGPEGNDPEDLDAAPSVGRASRRTAVAGIDRELRSDLDEDLPPAAEAERMLVDAGDPGPSDDLDRPGGIWRRADGSPSSSGGTGSARRDEIVGTARGESEDVEEEGPNPLPPAMEAAPGAAGRLLAVEPAPSRASTMPEPLPLPVPASDPEPMRASSPDPAVPVAGTPLLEAVPAAPAPPVFPPDPGPGGFSSSAATAAAAAGSSAAASEALIQKALDGPAEPAAAPPMAVDPTANPNSTLAPAPSSPATEVPIQAQPEVSPPPGSNPTEMMNPAEPTSASGASGSVSDPVFPPLTGEALVPVPSMSEPAAIEPASEPAPTPSVPDTAPVPPPMEAPSPAPAEIPSPAPEPAPESPPQPPATEATPSDPSTPAPPAENANNAPPPPLDTTPESAPAPSAEPAAPAPTDTLDKTALNPVKTATTWGAVAASAALPPLTSSVGGLSRRTSAGVGDGPAVARAMADTTAIGNGPAAVATESEPGEVLRVSCDYDARRTRLEDFTLPDLEGDPVRFRELGGDAELVLLDFWGTWCGPCLRTIPHLQEIQRSSGGRVRVVGIAYENTDPDEAAARVTATAKRLRINYPLLLGGIDGQVCPVKKAFNVRAFPTLVLLDRSGQVLWTGSGADAKTIGEIRARIAAYGRKDLARR